MSVTNSTTAVLSATATNVALTVVGDTLPSGFTWPGWTQSGSVKTLTNSGKQTYETTSLAGGLIKATVLCLGGTWTSTPTPPYVPRTVTDGANTTGSTTITSATAAFTANDVGAGVTGPGIPKFDTIGSVTNATTAVLKTAATSTGTGRTCVISPSTGYGPPLIAPVAFGAVAIQAAGSHSLPVTYIQGVPFPLIFGDPVILDVNRAPTTVTVASNAAAEGTVDFFDGATLLGTPFAHANSIRHCNANAWDDECRSAHRCSVLRSSALSLIRQSVVPVWP